MTHTIIQHTPLSPYTQHLWIDFQQSCLFYSLSQLHHVMASHPSPGGHHQSTGEWSERTLGQAKWPRETNSVAYAPVFPICHTLSAAYTVIHLLIKVTFTPSIHPNLVFPRTRPPFTSAINTFLVTQYSSVLSTCPKHLNTLWSTLIANSLSIPAE